VFLRILILFVPILMCDLVFKYINLLKKAIDISFFNIVLRINACYIVKKAVFLIILKFSSIKN